MDKEDSSHEHGQRLQGGNGVKGREARKDEGCDESAKSEHGKSLTAVTWQPREHRMWQQGPLEGMQSAETEREKSRRDSGHIPHLSTAKVH
ncbi:hypothetical protein [Mesorhizobium sp. M1403]|uniref:hypothetical protein n=1 Tax=Mesorhizobium sp. M1403 TaxID=2957097 RepID=UPI003334D15F